MKTLNTDWVDQCINAVVMTTADFTWASANGSYFYIYPNVDAVIKVDLAGWVWTWISFNVFAWQILPIQFSKFYNTWSTNHTSLIAIY